MHWHGIHARSHVNHPSEVFLHWPVLKASCSPQIYTQTWEVYVHSWADCGPTEDGTFSHKSTQKTVSLASQKITIAEKSLRFQKSQCKIASPAAEIAEDRRNKMKTFLGRGMNITAFLRFQNRSVFGALRLWVSAERGVTKGAWKCSHQLLLKRGQEMGP